MSKTEKKMIFFCGKRRTCYMVVSKSLYSFSPGKNHPNLTDISQNAFLNHKIHWIRLNTCKHYSRARDLIDEAPKLAGLSQVTGNAGARVACGKIIPRSNDSGE